MESSTFFVCPHCKEVWGMLEYPNRFWYPHYVSCKKCGKPEQIFQVPGSMLPVADVVSDEYLKELPLEMLRRECEVYIDFYTKVIET